MDFTLQSIKARYPDFFPLNCEKDVLKKAIDYFKDIDDKRIVVSCDDFNYKPYMLAFFMKYLSKHNKYPKILSLNVHNLAEIYITGMHDEGLLRLSDIDQDVVFLTAGYSEPNNKSLKDCIGFVINNLALKDKYLFIYLKGSTILTKEIENISKNIDIPKYNINFKNTNKKASKPSKGASNNSQLSLF